jgi:hypothetical protein
MNILLVVQIVSITSGIVGLAFASYTLWQQRLARERDLALRFLQSLQTPAWVRGLRIIFGLPDNLSKFEIEQTLGDDMDSVYTVMTTWESLGILTYRRLLSIDLIDDFFSGGIVISWRKLHRFVDDERAMHERETLLEWFQWLAERFANREAAASPIPGYKAQRDWSP